jgi:hypothetical protein
MDENKNWAFSTLNDLNSPPTPEEMLGIPELGPDGRPKPKLSAMEKYYQSLDSSGQAVSNEMLDVMTMIWDLKQLNGSNGVNPMIFAFPGGEQAMMKNMMLPPLSGHEPGDKGAGEDSISATDGAAPDAAAATAAATEREQDRRLNNFKQLLDGGTAAPVGSPDTFGNINGFLNQQPDAAAAYNPGYTPAAPVSATYNPSALSPVMGGFTPAASGYQPSTSGFNTPMLGPGGLDSATRNVLTQAPETTLPASLDPFKANFPKRQF